MSGNETIAKTLSYAGLIPFVIFSIGSWTPLPYITNSTQVLIAYAAIILSFMGAIHWGITMSSAGRHHSKNFIISVIPALAAWLALLLPEIIALVILITGFIFLMAYDFFVEKSQVLPSWYIPMRIKLTLIVILCLAAALVSVVLK